MHAILTGMPNCAQSGIDVSDGTGTGYPCGESFPLQLIVHSVQFVHAPPWQSAHAEKRLYITLLHVQSRSEFGLVYVEDGYAAILRRL
jgi:hypothetical protein